MATVETVLERGIQSHLQGNLATATQCYSAVLQSDPSNAGAWHLAGVAAHQCGRSRDALNYIQRAIELDPRNAEFYSNLTSVLRSRGHHDTALEVVEKALQIDPQMPAAWYQHGSLLLDLNRPQPAIESLLLALEHGHAAASVWNNIALAQQYQGNVASALESLGKSLQADARQPQVYYRLAQFVATGQYKFDDEQRQLMRAMVNDASTPMHERARVHSALAIDCERTGKYDAAFEHYREANERYRAYLTQARRIEFDSTAFQREVDLLIGQFPVAPIANATTFSADLPCPIFIVGMPRSGTTLVAQILRAHPDVQSAGEMTVMADLIAERQVECRETETELIQPTWLATAAERYLIALKAICGSSPYVIDKMPANFKYLGFIAAMFPNAKVVHCLRDPRDVCLSAYFQLFDAGRLQLESSDLTLLAHNYRHYQRMMNHWKHVLPTNIYDVTYEQLVSAPKDEIRQLLSGLELAWSDRCLNFHKGAFSVRTASSLQVRQPLYQSSVGRSKHYESQISELVEILSAPE